MGTTTDTPEIIGIPPDIVLLVNIEGIQRKMQSLLAEQKASSEGCALT